MSFVKAHMIRLPNFFFLCLLRACGFPASTPSPTEIIQPIEEALEPEALRLPDAVYDLFEGVEYDYYADRDFVDTAFESAYAEVLNGLLSIQGTGNWDSYWTVSHSYSRGEAALILFQYDPGSEFTIGFAKKDWDTPEYRYWGITEGTQIIAYVGTGLWGPDDLACVLKIKEDTWYYGLFTRSQQNGIFTFLR